MEIDITKTEHYQLRVGYCTYRLRFVVEKRRAGSDEPWRQMGKFTYLDAGWAKMVINMIEKRFPNFSYVEELDAVVYG